MVALYASIYVGSNMPLALPDGLLGLEARPAWIVILFLYAAIASMLPVWALLQPRDYINGIQLALGLLLLYGAVVIAMPDLSAPMLNDRLAEDAPSIVPLLFVTIACGAVSGFHGSWHPAPVPSNWTRKPTPVSSATSAPSARAHWR